MTHASHPIGEALSAERLSMPEYMNRYYNRTTGLHAADKEYLLSMNPTEGQLSVMLEKFNIGGKSGAPLYFSHDGAFVIKAP